MPPLRPQRGRSNGAVGATLMRSANQFNKRAPPRNGRTRQRRRVEGEGQTQRREANALTSHRAPRNVRLTRGQRARLTRGQERQQEHRTRERGQLEVAPRNYRDASHRSGVAAHKPRALAGTPPRPTPPSPHPQHPNEAPRNGRIRAPCVIRGASAAKRGPPWQDLRAMHSRKAICGAFRIHGAHVLPKPARFGCTAAICCQGGALFPSGGAFGIHEARILPRMAARERIAREYCHERPPGNAPWRHGAGKHRANETSANSTTCDDASKKP